MHARRANMYKRRPWVFSQVVVGFGATLSCYGIRSADIRLGSRGFPGLSCHDLGYAPQVWVSVVVGFGAIVPCSGTRFTGLGLGCHGLQGHSAMFWDTFHASGLRLPWVPVPSYHLTGHVNSLNSPNNLSSHLRFDPSPLWCKVGRAIRSQGVASKICLSTLFVGGGGGTGGYHANLNLRYLGGGWVFRLVKGYVGRISTCVMRSRVSIFMLRCDAFASALAHCLSRIHTYVALRCLAHQRARTRLCDDSFSSRACVYVRGL